MSNINKSLDRDISLDIIFECKAVMNDRQLEKLAFYALKLISDKRYKTKKNESIQRKICSNCI